MTPKEAEDKLARAAMDQLIADPETPIAAIDPVIIAILIKLLPVIIEILKDCQVDDAAKANTRAKKNRILDRILLNWAIRRELGRDGYHEIGGRAVGRAAINVGADDQHSDALTVMFQQPAPFYGAL